MPVRIIGLVAAITIVGLAGTASAQDEPKIGITMGYPAALGLVWQVNDRIALRPELGVTRSSNDLIATTSGVIVVGGNVVSNTSQLSSNSNWQASIGASVLYYLSKHDGLRTYVSPRWAYTRVSSDSSTDGASTSSSTGNSQTLSGSYGAQYAVGPRFSVFGEVGFAYVHTSNAPTGVVSFLSTSSTTNTVGTRGGAGVILYF